MNKKNVLKIVLDIIMTGVLVLLYNSHVLALTFHEVAGLTLAGLFIIHLLLNKKWIAAVSTKLFSKSLAPRARVGYIVNVLLLVAFTCIIISGIRTSQVLFPEFAAPKGTIWRTVHHFAGAMSIILIGVHIGLHWGFITGMFKRIIRIPTRIARPLNICLLIAILAFGSYSIATSSFSGWLAEPFSASSNASHQTSTSEETATLPSDEAKTDTNDNGINRPKEGERKGDNTVDNGGLEHPAGEKKTAEGNPLTIIHTALTFLSIMGVFAAITYYLDKLQKSKKHNREVS